MASKLYNTVEWTKENGEVKVIDRLRAHVLAYTIKEQISLSAVTPDTECSSECLDKVQDAASQLVGQPCPFKNS